MNDERGVIYIATGEKYVELAARSAQSLKKYCPGLPAHIFTERDISSYDCFDGSTNITDPHRRSKVDYIFKTPYQKTLYLDADTKICEDIAHMFILLDRFDLAITHVRNRSEKNLKRHVGYAPKSFPPVNGGVILFNKTGPVIEFFKNWRKAFYNEGFSGDQLTLRHLVWQADFKVYILPPEYNVRSRVYIKELDQCNISPKILHFSDYRDELEIKAERFSMPVRKKLRKQARKALKHFPRAEKYIFRAVDDFIEKIFSKK